MALAELKTKKTTQSVSSFIDAITDPVMREDSKVLVRMMEKASGAKGRIWGGMMIGFKDVHLKYASGRELDWFAIGFAPRKGKLTLSLCGAAADPSCAALFKKLGPHSRGVGCVYVKRLADVDLKVLEALLEKTLDSSCISCGQDATKSDAAVAPKKKSSKTLARSGARKAASRSARSAR